MSHLCLAGAGVACKLIGVARETTDARKLDARVSRTRAAVLDAGARILFTDGWDRVTHVRVAERSGVARATIYRHWPTVEDLLVDVILSYPSPNPVGKLTGHTRADLISEIGRFVRNLQQSKLHEIIVTAMERACTGSRQMREMHSAITRISRGPIWAVVSAAVEAGELDPELTEATAAAHTLGPLLYLRLFNGDRVSRRHVAAAVDAFLAAFSVPDARARRSRREPW